MLESDDFTGDFGQGGYVRFRRVNNSTAKVSIKTYVSKLVEYVGNVGVNIELSFNLTFQCGEGELTLDMSPIHVDNLSGNFTTLALDTAAPPNLNITLPIPASLIDICL